MMSLVIGGGTPLFLRMYRQDIKKLLPPEKNWVKSPAGHVPPTTVSNPVPVRAGVNSGLPDRTTPALGQRVKIPSYVILRIMPVLSISAVTADPGKMPEVSRNRIIPLSACTTSECAAADEVAPGGGR